MVQRKLLHLHNKLGIGIQVQADQLKYDDNFSKGLRPLSPRLHDGKTKGTDHLRIKMKKSRSVKHANVETLKSSPGFNKEIRRVSQPGRPPPLAGLQTCPGTSPQQPGGKTNEALPNYMKSTSSFDARKERFRSQPESQVSNKNSQTGSFSRNMQRHKSSSPKRTPDSCNTSTKTLKRSSSLKLARTLTRTPSFKPARPSSAKKCSKIVLCDDMDAHRATCSSTLKESKFPKYLDLNPGGTEADGTSVMKVCPYTYCSLNGHRHAPLPPLKCFLSTRRRMIKAQKNFGVEALSPRTRLKAPSIGDKLESQGSAVETDFFIEVYTKNQYADSIVVEDEKEVSDDENTDKNQIVADGLASKREGEDHLPGEPPRSGIDVLKSIPEEERGSKDADEISLAVLFQEETILWSSTEKHGHEDEIKGGTEALDAGSEATDMELDVGQYDTPKHEDESDYSTERDGALAFEFEYLSEASADTHEKPEFSSDLSIINWKLFPYDDNIDGEKDHAFSAANNLIATGCESEDSYQSSEISEYCQESDCLSYYDQCSTTDNDEFEVEAAVDSPGDDQSISRSDTYNNPGYIQHKGDAEDEPTKVTAENQEAVGESGAGGVAEEPHVTEPHLDGPILQIEAQDHSSNSQTAHVAENLNLEINQLGTKKSTSTSELLESEQQEDARIKRTYLDDSIGESDTMEFKQTINPDVNELTLKTDDVAGTQEKSTFVKLKANSPEELIDSKLKWTIKRKRLSEPMEDMRGFNPRDPNYLPLVLDPEAEKVDLKHQMMDERKNSEEWMIDYALQQAVTKLAPARKRKVALLVEAFEKVMPIPNCETDLKSTSTGFPHARPMQACN